MNYVELTNQLVKEISGILTNPWGPVREETEIEKLYRLEEHVF